MNPMNLTLAQILSYMQGKLPKAGWFTAAARTPGTVAYAILYGCAGALTYVMGVNQFVAMQIYLQTTSGGFLDLWAYDFFGTGVLRNVGESDVSFMNRVSAYLLAPTVTKAAIVGILTRLVFTTPVVREAFSPLDTASFSGTSYFGGGGNARFGSQSYPGQFFVEAGLPSVSAAGSVPTFGEVYYNTDPAYLTPTPSSNLSLADLYSVINFIRAAGILAWVKQL